MANAFQTSFQQAKLATEAVLASDALMSALDSASQAINRALSQGSTLFACGNGGSLCDANHFCEELTGRFRNDRPPLPAISLSDSAHITCVANDFGFEHIFSRSVLALGKPGDILICLSTSGNSQNLILAAEAAKTKGVTVIGLLGRDGGKLAPICDIAAVFPGITSDRIQELHMIALHRFVELAEIHLGYHSE